MFRGKKVFRYFNNPDAPKEKCIKNFISEEDFVVQHSSSNGRSYIKFDSCDSFFSWYQSIPKDKRTFFEVIREGWQKFRVDIDERVENIDLISDRIKIILKMYGIKLPKIIVFDIETSYHLVLSNYVLSQYHCKMLAGVISKVVNIDMGVYSKLQHFRIEGNTKYGQRRWKERTREPLNLENFHEGVITSRRNTRIVQIFIPMEINVQVKGINVGENIPRGFKIRKTVHNMVILDRVRPTYCNQCRRVHNKENGYMIDKKFFCWRFHSS